MKDKLRTSIRNVLTKHCQTAITSNPKLRYWIGNTSLEEVLDEVMEVIGEGVKPQSGNKS